MSGRPPGAGPDAEALRTARRARWVAGALAAAIALPLVAYLPHIGGWDNDQMVALHALARWNLFAFGPVKQWDPLLCGGTSLAGDPQVPVLSVTALLGYALGPLLGVRLGCALLVVVGFAGARRLGRVWFGDEATATLFAGLFALRFRAVRLALAGGLGRRLVVVAAVGVVLGLGSAWPLLGDALPTPFEALRRLPGFGAVRAPSRFWFALVPLLAAAGAVALRAELARPGGRGLVVSALVVASLGAYGGAWAHRSFAGSPWLEGLGAGLGATSAADATDVRFVAGRRDRMLADLAVDTGVLRCYWPGRFDGAKRHRQGRLRVVAFSGGDGSEVPGTEVPGAVARARFEGWNRIRVAVPVEAESRPQPMTVVIDHNFHRRWRASDGEVLRSPTGRLALSLPAAAGPDRREVVLAFSDPWSVSGAWLSAAALLLVVAAAVGRRANRGAGHGCGQDVVTRSGRGPGAALGVVSSGSTASTTTTTATARRTKARPAPRARPA